MMFPGEQEAIRQVVAHGAAYGYGNMIHHLRLAWADMLQREYRFDRQNALVGAGLEEGVITDPEKRKSKGKATP